MIKETTTMLDELDASGVRKRTALETLDLLLGTLSLLLGSHQRRRVPGPHASGRCDDSARMIAYGITRSLSNGVNIPEEVPIAEPRPVRSVMFIPGGCPCAIHEACCYLDPGSLILVENALPAPVEIVARIVQERGVDLVVFNPIPGPREHLPDTLKVLAELAQRCDAAVLGVLECDGPELEEALAGHLPFRHCEIVRTILVAQPHAPFDEDLEMLNDPDLGWCPARGALLSVEAATGAVKFATRTTVDEEGASFRSLDERDDWLPLPSAPFLG